MVEQQKKVALNDISTGASNDLQVATKIARDMITVYGMSDVVGPISLQTNDVHDEPILGDHIENTIGEEVKRIIDVAYSSAQKILLDNMPLLHAIAEELLKKEKISEEEFEEFFK